MTEIPLVLTMSTPVVDVASLSYKTNNDLFLKCVCHWTCLWDDWFLLLPRWCLVTRQTLRVCHNNNEGPMECCCSQHGESMRWIHCLIFSWFCWYEGWVGLEYCIITALPLGVALLILVHCLLSVQMRHGDKDVHNCVPVKLNNSIMLVFYQ